MLPPRTYVSLFSEAASEPVPAQSVWEPVVITPALILPYRGTNRGFPHSDPILLRSKELLGLMPKNCSVLGCPHPPWYPEPCSPIAPREVHLPQMRPGQAPWAKCQMLSSSWKGWGPGMTRHPGLERKKVVPLLTQLLLPSGKQGDPGNKHSSLWTPAFSPVKGKG